MMRFTCLVPALVAGSRLSVQSFPRAASHEIYEDVDLLSGVEVDHMTNIAGFVELQADLSPHKDREDFSFDYVFEQRDDSGEVRIPVISVEFDQANVPLVGVISRPTGLYPMVLTTFPRTTAMGGQSLYIRLSDRKVYSNLDRSVYVDLKENCPLSLDVDSAYHGPIRWVEDLVVISRLPIGSYDPEIGHLNASPGSGIMRAIGGFTIEISEEGKYEHLIVSPSDDVEFSYLGLADEAELDAFVIAGKINGEVPVDVVLDTTSSAPVVCRGPVGPISITSLDLKGHEYMVEASCGNPDDSSHVFASSGLVPWAIETLTRPTLVVNPSAFKGTVIHFDGVNRRVGFKPLDL